MNRNAKVISWNICGICNYNCSYCTQKSSHTGEPSREEIIKMIRFFKSLGPGWEIKISGGEPFFYAEFIYVIKELVKAGMKISVVTNFSFPIKVYKEFVKITRKCLKTFSASLHLEKVNWEEFLEKAVRVKNKIDRIDGASFVVNSVVTRKNIYELMDIKKTYMSRGVKLYPQLLKVNGKPIEYTENEMKMIEELADGKKDIASANLGYSMKGRQCLAGANYFVVLKNADCYTCYPGKKSKEGALGNVLKDTVKLKSGPILCPYEVCPCTVPINRGIVEIQ